MLSVFTIPFKVMLLRKTIFFELRIKRLQENSCVFREDISRKHDLREKNVQTKMRSTKLSNTMN